MSIGKISKKSDYEIEWAIEKFSSYTEIAKAYESSWFVASDSEWCFQIHPNGTTSNNSVGYISLYVLRKNNSKPQGACFRFGIKKSDGTVRVVGEKHLNWVFDENDPGFGHASVISKFELLQRKEELVPSDVLTFTCILWVNKSADSYAGLETLSANLIYLYTSQRNCDATFRIKRKTFRVHKSILSARSSVLATAFDADLNRKRTEIVDTEDFNPDAFESFIKFLYGGKVDYFSNNVFELYKIADKYDVRELTSACAVHIMGNLSVENIFEAATFCYQFGESGINHKVQRFFNENFSEIVCSPKWESYLKENAQLVTMLLKSMSFKMKLQK